MVLVYAEPAPLTDGHGSKVAVVADDQDASTGSFQARRQRLNLPANLEVAFVWADYKLNAGDGRPWGWRRRPSEASMRARRRAVFPPDRLRSFGDWSLRWMIYYQDEVDVAVEA